jgi:hypothetical protein
VKFHKLKSWPEYFKLLMAGDKSFEIRKNDRDYECGDICQLFEWIPPVLSADAKGVPVLIEPGRFTGSRSPYYRVIYICTKTPGLMPGYVLLLLEGPWGGKPPEELST